MKKETKQEVEPQNEIAVVREKVKGMQSMIDSSPVTNEEQLQSVADKIKNVKILEKFIKEKKDKFVAPAKAIVDEAKATYDPLIKECQNAEIVLKERAKKYMLEQERARIAEENKIAARVEKGTMKPETAAAKIEAMPEVQKTVITETGSGLRMAKRKVAKIVDQNLIADDFWIVDEVRVRREALERERYGKDPIPGVTIEMEADLSSV
ncbi:MAG: hypothetical protein ACEQSB_06115 [Undibacterium sp.]